MKIAAVVVTYNRLNLLKECIEAIRNQTHKVDEIIVVNNSSTDGTLEWLNKQNDLTVITQENSGSAGGQYTGIKTAYEKGYDWIWCMDDDGLPTYNCLEKLLNCKNFSPQNCYNSLILDKNTKKLSFHIPLLSSYIKILDYYCVLTNEPEKIKKESIDGFYGWGMFFNSTLLSREIIKDVGLPRKDFFIWGDEVEYFYRIKEKYKVLIVLDSIFYHPAKRNEKINNNLKYKYYFRNYVYINKKYKKLSLIRNLILLLKILSSKKLTLIKYFIKGFKVK